MSVCQGEKILRALQKVDEGLCRPLYALFITDAWLEGKDLAHWKKKEVLEWVLQKEKLYYHKQVEELAGKRNVRLKKIMDQIRVAATLYRDISLGALETDYPELWRAEAAEESLLLVTVHGLA